MLNFFSYFNNSQIWLDQLIDDCHLSNITKLKKNTGPTIPPKPKEELPKAGQSVFWREKEEKKRKKRE